MTTIEEFYLSEDYKVMYVKIVVPLTFEVTILHLYIGDDYLSDTFADLSAYITSSPNYVFSIDTPEIKALYDKEIFDGPFTIVVTTDEGPEFITGRTLINMYYADICLANKTLALDSPDKMNEVFMLFLYMNAAVTYVLAGQTEQALGAWDRVSAIVQNSGSDALNTDVLPCGQGTGCWIINGVYVIKY
jgi:hypothetical protein